MAAGGAWADLVAQGDVARGELRGAMGGVQKGGDAGCEGIGERGDGGVVEVQGGALLGRAHGSTHTGCWRPESSA